MRIEPDQDHVTTAIKQLTSDTVRDYPVRVDFLCNSGRSGMFLGHAEAVHIGGGSALELVADALKYPTFKPVPAFAGKAVKRGECLRFLRQLWPYSRTIYGVGNWQWDAYFMTAATVRRLLCHMLEYETMWECQGGYAELGDWWDGTLELSEDRMLELLVEAEMRNKL